MLVAVLATLVVFSTIAGPTFAQAQRKVPCIPYPQCDNQSELYDYFFIPEQRYAKNPTALKLLAPGRVVEDRYSSEPLEVSLRPIGTRVKVPRHYLTEISRPFVRPYALKHWDYVSVEVLLPTYEPRTRENESLFFDGSSLDVLSIRIGGLTGELDYPRLRSYIEAGVQVFVRNRKDLALDEFRRTEHKGKISAPLFFVSDGGAVKSFGGHPLVIDCLMGWWEGVDEAISCQVNLAIPRALWPASMQTHFGGVKGLGLTYRYTKKHLSAWREIHAKVLTLVDDFLTDITLATQR